MKHWIAFLMLSLLQFSCQEEALQIVATKGRKLLVNNTPYTIKGLCYHPVPKGETNRRFDQIDIDLQLLKEAGVNTLRLYAPLDDSALLDKINSTGIKVIIGFGYNQEGVYDIASGTVMDYVQKYKDHPAILFWELGNEYNYHPEWFEGDIENWYLALETTAQKIKQIDANHPVGTAHGELPTAAILKNNPSIDIWGINVYRWDQPHSLITAWETLSELPLYFSEAGADSFMAAAKDDYTAGENQRAQADATRNILQQTFARPDIVNGVTLFSFTDGWWKAGNPDQQDQGGWAPFSSGVPYDGAPNEEYWGIVDINRNKKEAFFVVEKQYNQNLSSKEKTKTIH
jgi:hypothetical protein